ncbi:MAG: efflux RND transporter periplasmic adaptor subunit [Burkholderiaceae bacterium]
MKNLFLTHRRTLALIAVLVPLIALFGYVALRAGPLASVPVTVTKVLSEAIAPALFGIGTVEARYTHKIGPTFAGRLRQVAVQPGEHVKAGQLLAEMDPIDLDDKISAQDATIKRADAGVDAVQAQIQELTVRRAFAQTQASRYDKLRAARAVSGEAAEAKRNEYQVAQASLSTARANLAAARQELARSGADRAALMGQRANLRLVSPVDGLVSRRDADAGTTVIAGQAVVEVVEPASVWINVRFDQQRAGGLQAGLSATIVLRSRGDTAPLAGKVVRIEPHADAVTQEILGKVAFNALPQPLPPIGELAEVTVALAVLDPMPVVPNASIQRVRGRLGVWVVEDGDLRFAQVSTGASDLDGQVQIRDGLAAGAKVVVYSQKALTARSRIKVVESIDGSGK